MIRLSKIASSSQLQTAFLSALLAGHMFVSVASAVDLDFSVANGNYNVAGNWIDGDTGVVSGSPPTVDDTAYVRNNGTLAINSDVEALEIKIGATLVLMPGDYNDDGFVDASDYVVWRKGGPLLNDATPGNQPGDYDVWRSRFDINVDEQVGMPGALNWTAGKITGRPNTGGNTGGPVIRVGRHQVVSSVIHEVPGTVVQNGPTTELLLPYGESRLDIGDAGSGGFSHTPISSYTLTDGTIGLAVSSGGVSGSRGTNDNNGILVRNGTFTMTGGNLINVTPELFMTAGPTAQRFLTIASQSGTGEGNEAVSTANLSGGNIDVLGGIRVALGLHTRGYLNINGPVTIVTGGDTSIGYQNTNNTGVNAVGEMNMSDGSFQVGRTDNNPVTNTPYNLAGRLNIGDRGKGILNMSGGTINVTREVVVGNDPAYNLLNGSPATLGSIINLTGGTITTGGLSMRRDDDSLDPILPVDEYSASIIVDGPTASFITTGQGQSPTTVIGNFGKALFEVRQGTAVLGGGGAIIQVGNSTATDATINVKGGKLTLGGNVNRSNLGSADPKIGLTGGTLEFNNTVSFGTHVVHADLKNVGTKLVIRPDAVQLAQIGSSSPAVPANFEMTGGSWDIDMGTNSLTGADWFNVPNGTASLTGGTLNINYLAGFTPNVDQVFRILRASGGTTLNSGAITITGAGAGSWMLQEVPISGLDEEIQLKYLGPGAGAGLDTLASGVPEPSSAALLVFGIVASLATRRARHRVSA